MMIDPMKRLRDSAHERMSGVMACTENMDLLLEIVTGAFDRRRVFFSNGLLHFCLTTLPNTTHLHTISSQCSPSCAKMSSSKSPTDQKSQLEGPFLALVECLRKGFRGKGTVR
jgi:hypothetical protein